MKKFKLLLATLGLSVLIFQAPAPVFAQSLFERSKNEACAGAQLEASAAANSCTQPAQTSFNKLLQAVLNIFSVIIGVAAVIMIMVGGFRYITSGGDSNSVSSAKNTILYAVIGLIIVAVAQFIVKFVLNKATA